MSQLLWNTPAGNIGTYPSRLPITYTFSAIAPTVGDSVEYILLNGVLPIGVSLLSNGQLTGVIGSIAEETVYSFTIRAKDSFNSISDRTFSLTVSGVGIPVISTPDGQIANTLDSVYVDKTINVTNYANIPYIIKLSGGSLPPGLSISNTGRITGYAEPPILTNGSPTTKTYEFALQLISEYGVDGGIFNIVVRNQLLTKSPHQINPVILNSYPLELPISTTDPYYSYYLVDTINLGTTKSGEYFNFKFIGYDFEDDSLTYSFGSLPPGLTGNSTTGWITGVPIIASNTIIEYGFTVVVYKTLYPSIKSSIQRFVIRVSNEVDETITWNTDSDLGTLLNGELSDLYVDATGFGNLSYELVSGRLPDNLSLLSNGSIIGKVSFEPESFLTMVGTKITYAFTVKAFLTDNPIVSSTKEFTLTTDKQFLEPTESVYLKATPDLPGRAIIQSLLTDTSIIPNEYLYRPEDVYFGKASDIRVVVTYGVNASKLTTYLDTLNTNFYYRKIVLGELKTAIATNENNETLYEVVYSEIVDGLITPDGVSIPDEIVWPRKISLNQGDYYTSNTSIYNSSTEVFTSASPGFVQKLYPASLQNMRNKIISTIPYNNSQTFLPLWMTSQQADGSTLGFKQVWVICYTLPGKSQEVLNNINDSWPYKLNQIDFSIDRFIVDKSATYNYNLYPGIPSWSSLPGATPTPDPLDTYDLPVLFSNTNILPNSNQ
jgi:hypothetical protein